MSYYLLARAYYDLYGNFEQLGNFFLGDRLENAAKERGISLTEYCCQALGFPADNTYSAEERMNRRTLAVDMKDPKLLNLFPGGTVKKSMLKANNIQPFFTRKQITAQPEYSDAVQTIVNFIEHTGMVALKDKSKNSTVPLSWMFSDLKLARNEAQLEQTIPQFESAVKMILGSARVVTGIPHCYVAAGKIILSHNISDIDLFAKDVLRHLGRRSLTMPADHFYFITSNMPYYQLSDPLKSQTYVRMVELAAVYDMTIAELIQYAGFAVPDQFAAYRLTGYFVYELPGSRFLCIDPLDSNNKKELTYADLRSCYKLGRD